jgi:hypothetical protein
MFEYRVWSFLPHKLRDEDLQLELTKLGQVGWELVSIHASNRQPTEQRAIFRRSVSGEAKPE